MTQRRVAGADAAAAFQFLTALTRPIGDGETTRASPAVECRDTSSSASIPKMCVTDSGTSARSSHAALVANAPSPDRNVACSNVTVNRSRSASFSLPNSATVQTPRQKQLRTSGEKRDL